MRTNAGLTKQSIIASVVAAYVGAYFALATSLIWRIQAGTSARLCPADVQSLSDWCTVGELSLALVLNFLWAGFGLPFAFVIAAPCALMLGRLAPKLESWMTGRALAAAQFILGALIGLIAGLFFELALAGVLAGVSGVWMFRRYRYPKDFEASKEPNRPSL